jgi:hypothetical protein
MLNLTSYKVINTRFFVFEEPKLRVSQMIADDINAVFNHSNSVIAYESHVRGYLNTLYNRGIYEHCNIEKTVQKAAKKGRQYAVMLYRRSKWAYVDMRSGELFEVKFENGSLTTTKFSAK